MTRFVCFFIAYPSNATIVYAPGQKAALRKFAQIKGYRWIAGDMRAVKA